MKRIALALAIVAMAAAACNRGEQGGTSDTMQMTDTAADTTRMSDTTMVTPDTTTS
ncbi:MAG: hypothetical protein ACREMN_05400 [Gemmatimonadales bacterium]